MTDTDNQSQQPNNRQSNPQKSSGGSSHSHRHKPNRNPQGQPPQQQQQTQQQTQKPPQAQQGQQHNQARSHGRHDRYPRHESTVVVQPPTVLETGYQSILNITNLAVIAVLIGLIIFIVKIASVFGIFIFSFIIAFLLYPMVDWFAQKRIPRIWSILIVYLIFGSLLFAASAAILPTIFAQATSLIQQIPQIVMDLQRELTPKFADFERYLNDKGVTTEQIKNYTDQISPTLQSWAAKFGNQLLTGLQKAVGGIVALFSIPIIVFYLLLDATKIRDNLMGLIPHRTAGQVSYLLSRLSQMLNHYIRGQLKLCFIIFAMETTGLLILGVPHALLLGVLGGLTEVVPIIGPIVAFIPSFILSIFFPWDTGIGGMMMIQAPWVRGLIIILFYMLVQWFENNLIVPRVMGHNLNLHPLTVMFALLVGGLLAGIFGMLIALPISACLKVVFEIYYTPFIERIEELISRRPVILEEICTNGSGQDTTRQEISNSRTYE
jgi:predicted PurR-regulated permease PerM